MHLYSVWFQLFSGDFIVTLIIIISGYVYDVDNKQITVIWDRGWHRGGWELNPRAELQVTNLTT